MSRGRFRQSHNAFMASKTKAEWASEALELREKVNHLEQRLKELEGDKPQAVECPQCGQPSLQEQYSGVRCSRCDYWFCY